MRLTLHRLGRIITEELLNEFYATDPMETATSDYWIDFRERVRVIVNMVEAGTTDQEAAVDLVNEMPHVPPGAGYNSFEQLVADLEESEQLAAGAARAPMDELVKPARGGYHVEKPESVEGYWRDNEDGTRTWVKRHKSESDTLALDYAPERLNPKSDEGATDESDLDEKKRKKKKKKEYHASAGSVAALRDSGDSCDVAIKAGKFDWAGKGKWAACQSAHIVATGKPTVPQGSKFKGGEGPHGGGEGSHMVKPRKKRKKGKK